MQHKMFQSRCTPGFFNSTTITKMPGQASAAALLDKRLEELHKVRQTLRSNLRGAALAHHQSQLREQRDMLKKISAYLSALGSETGIASSRLEELKADQRAIASEDARIRGLLKGI